MNKTLRIKNLHEITIAMLFFCKPIEVPAQYEPEGGGSGTCLVAHTPEAVQGGSGSFPGLVTCRVSYFVYFVNIL